LEDFEILFVDDEREILSIVENFLSPQGYRVTLVDSGLKALELIKERDFDIVFTDLKMPEFGGLELLTAIKEYRPETEVIIVTGYGTIESAIKAMKFGSYDYLQKPIKLERLKILIDRIIEKRKLQRENIFLKKRLKERHKYDELIGISPRMQEIYEIIDRISLSSPTVLIQGESGTGKELVARVIHKNSDRKDKPFVPVNCGAIVEGIQETELFSHVMSLFEAAQGGTIFLDEIAEITPSLQVKLLQAFQEKEISPESGKIVESDIDVRVMAATKRDAEEAIKSGHLRKDLFYRLDVFSIKIPPLRERKEDICILLNHFLNKFSARTKRKVVGVSPEAMGLLLDYHWPGNVRQLGEVIERAFALGVEETIKAADLPSEIIKFGETSKKY
jgi:DNA-binding NtrC family response regulator